MLVKPTPQTTRNIQGYQPSLYVFGFHLYFISELNAPFSISQLYLEPPPDLVWSL